MVDDDEVFKRSANSPDQFEEKVATLRKEIDDRNERLKEISEKIKDPVYLAGMMLAVQNERENTNRILKSIYVELEVVKGIEERVRKLEELKGKIAEMPDVPSEIMLPEADEQIVAFIKKKGKACAAEVARELKYRGKNAAAQRLIRLWRDGILQKQNAGRTVWYSPGK